MTIHQFKNTFIQPLKHTFPHSYTHSPICTHIHPIMHTFTQSCTHSPIHTTKAESVRSSTVEASRSGTPRHSARRSRGIEPATFSSPADPLYLPSHTSLCEWQDAFSGYVLGNVLGVFLVSHVITGAGAESKLALPLDRACSHGDEGMVKGPILQENTCTHAHIRTNKHMHTHGETHVHCS